VPLLTKAKVAAADFERIRTLSPVTSESHGAARFAITGDVSFHHVSFRYPSRPDAVFTDLSFSLASGAAVAIVGPSGAGKSTVAALMQRLYLPSSGSIKLGNYDLSSADVRAVRAGIAVVSQTPHLFDASVADNIRYGGDASLEEVVEAAKEARIHDFVAGLPQGYETRLGENAALISGGQAQRLQIARALLRHAKILILDEATSALDPENQAGIVDTILAIKQVGPGWTLAHAEPHDRLHHAQRRRHAPVRPHHLPRGRARRRGRDVRRAPGARGRVRAAPPDGRVGVDS
jgi:ATP-binding cassette subfamily B (MDR/TAP) protein 1